MNLADEVERRVYEQEVKRMQGAYGPDAEIPNSALNRPIGLSGSNLMPPGAATPVSPIHERIGELCKQLTDAGHQLVIARQRDAEARHFRKVSEEVFSRLADELMQTIQTHREGVPEGMPYPR